MRLFIADADPALRVSMQMLLHQKPGMHVIGIAVQAKGLLVQVEASQPDVLLLDSHLPGAPMTELLEEILGLDYPPKVVVLAVNPAVEAPALSAGADAFINKNGPPDELLRVLRSLKKSSVDSIN